MSAIRKQLLTEIGRQYKGLPKEQWSAYRRAQFLFDENKVSENRYCRQPGAATVDAETYLTLLQSSRRHRDLVDVYHGKGERSIKEAAEAVGLKLPILNPDL